MKILTAPHMERCIGCLLCVLEAGRSPNQRSLNDSLIRIVPEAGGFLAEIDRGRVASLKIVEACPRNCLVLTPL